LVLDGRVILSYGLLTLSIGPDADGSTLIHEVRMSPAGSQDRGHGQMLAKAAAFLCCVVAVGLLIASMLIPSPARASQTTVKLKTVPFVSLFQRS
jgi:hypothetical protein